MKGAPPLAVIVADPLLPPLHDILVCALKVSVGVVQALQPKVHANGSVNGVTSLVLQFAVLKIAVLKFVGESLVTVQLYIALSTSGIIAIEFVEFRTTGSTD